MIEDVREAAHRLIAPVQVLRQRALALETAYEGQLASIAPAYLDSARNLLHYLAVRQSDIRELQTDLALLGLSSLGRMESVTMATLNAVLVALHSLAGESLPPGVLAEPPVDFRRGATLLDDHTRRLFGAPAGKRDVRIMVTMPSEAAANPEVVRELLAAGMDIMRINCAHDGPQEWSAMIRHCREAERELGRPCKIYADLAGPKLRTGAIEPAGRVVKIQPKRDLRGRVVEPARLCFVPGDRHERAPIAGAIPIPPAMWAQIRCNDELKFKDTRGRNRILTIGEQDGDAWLATSEYTCYLEAGTALRLVRRGQRIARGLVGLLPEVILPLTLHMGDTLLLVPAGKPGRAARYDANGLPVEPARISCSLDAVFDAVRPGEQVWLDDGKIGAVVTAAEENRIQLTITHAPPSGARLRAEKGINLPDTMLAIPALNEKDLADLALMAPSVDIVGLSFVRTPSDVESLHDELGRLGAGHLGVVLKVETRQAFEHLPRLLLASLRRPPVGIMLARGDLAVEMGFERLAEVQEEILWLCEAAHVPVIWATQVLESLAKTGQPSRAEVTDAVMSGRAECVMLNKGPYMTTTVEFLNGVLERMEAHQSKKRAMLRKLAVSQVG